MLNIYSINENKEYLLTDEIYDKLSEALDVITKHEGVKCDVTVDLTFVDDEEIRGINKENRDIDKSTDVLSFPLISYDEGKVYSEHFKKRNPTSDLFFDDMLMLGDVIISLDTAESQAKEYNHSVKREIVFLFTHSILHLLGYDHMEEDERKIMNQKEDEYMNLLDVRRENNES